MCCNVLIKNLRSGRVKVKYGFGISILLSKSSKTASGLTSLSDVQIAINRTYAFTSHAQRLNYGFNRGIFDSGIDRWNLWYLRIGMLGLISELNFGNYGIQGLECQTLRSELNIGMYDMQDGILGLITELNVGIPIQREL